MLLVWTGHPPALTKIATSLGIDVLRMDTVAARVLSRWPLIDATERSQEHSISRTSSCASGRSWLFAQRGQDKTHPSPEGHLLIGSAMARFVSSTILASIATPAVAHYALPPSNDRPTWERCYQRADQLQKLQLAAGSGNNGDGWWLMDDGLAKGVPKLSLRSERVGDRLRLGWPIEWLVNRVRNHQPDIRTSDSLDDHVTGQQHAESPPCRPSGKGNAVRLVMEVGYRLSRDSAFGALKLECLDACRCFRLPSVLATKLAPFPMIDTNADLSTNEHVRNVSTYDATMTATTTFLADVSPSANGANCTLQVTHVPAGAGLSRSLLQRWQSQGTVLNHSMSIVRMDSWSMWCERDHDH